MKPPLADGAERWRGARGACAWLAVLAAILLRFHPLLSADATFPHHDWLQVHEPDAAHVVQAAREGSLVPLWSPFVLGGSPLYAVATKPFSYPPFLLAPALLGATLAMNVLVLLHVLLAAAGMLRLARRVGCGPAPAAAAAILLIAATWPGSLFKSQPFWAFAIAWWPWALTAALDVLEARERRALLSGALRLGAFMALQVLAGGVFQVYWLAVFLAVFALPFLLRRGAAADGARRFGALVLAAALCLGLCAVRALPALEWMGSSGRSGGLADDEILSGYDDIAAAGSAHPALAVLEQMLLRGDRVGTWAMAAGCVLGALFAPRRRVAWAALAGVVVCVIIATGAPHELLARWLPGYDRMRLPYRFLAPAGLGAALLAALGAEGLLRRLPRSAAGPALAAGAALLLLDVALLPGLRWTVPASASMTELRAMAEPVFTPMQDGSGRRFITPHARFQTLWIERGLRSTAGVLGGAGSESPAFTEWLPSGAAPLEREARQRGVLDVLAVRWTCSFEPLALPWLRPVFEPDELVLPVTAAGRVRVDALTGLDAYQDYTLRNLRGEGEAYRRPFVYERAGALPHVALVARPVLVLGAEEARAAAIREALDRRSFDARAAVYLEDPALDPATLDEAALAGLDGVLFAGADERAPAPHALRKRAGGRVAVQKAGVLWEPDAPRGAGLQPVDEARVVTRCNDLSVDLPAAAPLLLLSETFVLHAGWTASIDGAPAPLLRADGCITALRLPPGARQVVLRYRPPGLATGLLVSCATLVLLGAGALWLRRRA